MIKAVAGTGLALALAALSGCVPPTAPVLAEAPAPAAAAAPVALIPVPPPPAPVYHHAAARHTAVHHPVAQHRRVTHRYASRVRTSSQGVPFCGVERPCNVEHVVVPVH